MNLNDILRLPAHKLGTMPYEAYAQLLKDVIRQRAMLSSIQERETNAFLYRQRADTLGRIDAMKNVLAMHQYYDRFCEQLIHRVAVAA